MRLSDATLARLPPAVARPGYDRAAVQPGIVHLGIGAFHRAHQAVCTDAVLRGGDLRWGTVGVSLRSPATRNALAPQDGLFALNIRAEADEYRVIGSVQRLLVAPESPGAVIEAMTRPEVRIVSLTITEKGYCLDPSGGPSGGPSCGVDAANPDIRHDLAHPASPRSAPGLLVEAIARRRAAGLAPFTVLSCDNLAGNGKALHRVLRGLAGLRGPHSGGPNLGVPDHGGPDLAAYVADRIACPSTMVDRIVPATTDADLARTDAALGMHDAWPVVGEPFLQWVIEDRFSAGRPDWESHGATVVADVAPFEAMKLRLLNASHSALAYLGLLAGCETVADAVADPRLAAFAAGLMRDAARTVAAPPGTDVQAYQQALLARFANRALRHRLAQIAMDGTQKLPPRLLAPMQELLAQGQRAERHAMAVAAWMQHVATAAVVQDPRAEELARVVRADGPAALLDLPGLFGAGPPSPAARRAVLAALAALPRVVGRA